MLVYFPDVPPTTVITAYSVFQMDKLQEGNQALALNAPTMDTAAMYNSIQKIVQVKQAVNKQ